MSLRRTFTYINSLEVLLTSQSISTTRILRTLGFITTFSVRTLFVTHSLVANALSAFKSHSLLHTLSVSHALAQSTLLARYETLTNSTLSAPSTTSIPQQLASTGSLHLSRTEALKITGRLFKLRRDVNLVSNVLDVPELFWDQGQASLRALYDAVREYMEISQRVTVLNEKLAVASDLLELIRSHLNDNAMDRITWIIIWYVPVISFS